jgi:hypothetical protein
MIKIIQYLHELDIYYFISYLSLDIVSCVLNDNKNSIFT